MYDYHVMKDGMYVDGLVRGAWTIDRLCAKLFTYMDAEREARRVGGRVVHYRAA